MELQKYFGILYSLGISRKPSIRDHWSSQSLLQTQTITRAMSRSRFEAISRYLRFYNDDVCNKDDYLYKIREFISLICRNSILYYQPSNFLSLDETMIAFRGRHYSRIYMPQKPTKYGFKCFLLCDSESGYMLQWIMYNRKNKFKISEIVSEILSPYYRKGYQVYLDRYYTMPNLLLDLAKNQRTFGVEPFIQGDYI